jgi:hypothetical protein
MKETVVSDRIKKKKDNNGIPVCIRAKAMSSQFDFLNSWPRIVYEVELREMLQKWKRRFLQ